MALIIATTIFAAFHGGQPLLSLRDPSRLRACVASQDEPKQGVEVNQDEPQKTAQGVEVKAAATDIKRLLRDQTAADVAAVSDIAVDKEPVTDELLDAAIEAMAKAVEETGMESAYSTTMDAAKAKQRRAEQTAEEKRALELEKRANAEAAAEDLARVGLSLGDLGVSAGLAFGDALFTLTGHAGKAVLKAAEKSLEPEPKPEPEPEPTDAVKGYAQDGFSTVAAGLRNLAALKLEEGKARAETEALRLKLAAQELPEKAAVGAREAIVSLPRKAARGAKEALFAQQQTARCKVSAARQKKCSVAKKVQANNAHFKQSAHDFGEAVRVIVPGLKPTPPPPPPKKFFGLF